MSTTMHRLQISLPHWLRTDRSESFLLVDVLCCFQPAEWAQHLGAGNRRGGLFGDQIVREMLVPINQVKDGLNDPANSSSLKVGAPMTALLFVVVLVVLPLFWSLS